MSKFINTADVIGEDALVDSIIDRSITEYKENRVLKIGHYAFYGCTALAEVDLPNCTTIGSGAFQNCASLTDLNLPNCTTIENNAFRGISVTEIDLPKCTRLGNEPFVSNTLIKADIGKLASCGTSFRYCSNLRALILRGSSIPAASHVLVVGGTPIESGTGYIYVPRALVEDYKVATNWSTYATQFRALEDYTVDGTITGELDETKI